MNARHSSWRIFVRRIEQWRRDLEAVYIYFDNDQAAYAVENALELKRMVSERQLAA